jgi:hypothetical protein
MQSQPNTEKASRTASTGASGPCEQGKGRKGRGEAELRTASCNQRNSWERNEGREVNGMGRKEERGRERERERVKRCKCKTHQKR